MRIHYLFKPYETMRYLTSVLFLCLLIPAFSFENMSVTSDGRITLALSGDGWYLWEDRAAQWEHDKLYLPDEATDLSRLPVNPPTGGWDQLHVQQAKAVHVPGTVEEYATTTDHPQPHDHVGVSWWFRTLEVPAKAKGKRVIIHFESVRLRAEVYLDGQLVAYDMIGESPFDADITHAVKPGHEQCLAIRVTNPGGNFHWQDFNEMHWGDYQIPPGRGFGGIIGRVWMDIVDPVYITDIYMQNQPRPTTVKALMSVYNVENKTVYRDVILSVKEKGNPEHSVWEKKMSHVRLVPGDNQISTVIECPEAKLWNPDTPFLYTCRVELHQGRQLKDRSEQTFGFRWFDADGIGKEAVLRLNGQRVMLKSAISWGYWPVTGLYATSEMAEKQVMTAKSLGLNMLNFHRSIGSPVVLEKADELGLLYYEEPGSFHSAGHDPFIRTMVNTKLRRMIKRDRSHPSLIIYNLINEFGGVRSRDKALVEKRMNDMRAAHAIDPSRIMTFTSGWASKELAEEDSKAHMMPFDTLLYRKGWFDNHRAGGPATWEEKYYQSPTENLMYTDNHTEIYMRGEEGAISTPPRIVEIAHEIDEKGTTGWDGLFWKTQYEAFQDYFRQNKLADSFGTVDSLTRLMGDVSFDHQVRRIQGMRMQDLEDSYVINGWEAMPYDNHSGIVDIYRNPKGNLSTLAYYTQPLYVAVVPRTQFVRLPGKAFVDFYLINEKNLNGEYLLSVHLCTPDGLKKVTMVKEVCITGGDRFGELLWENCEFDIPAPSGMYRIEACLSDKGGTICAQGKDEILGIEQGSGQLIGKGALYGPADNAVNTFYQSATGNVLPTYRSDMEPQDWIIVTRPSLDTPQLVEQAFFKQPLTVSYFQTDDISALAATGQDRLIDRNFTDGAQPDASLPANQSFSIIWNGTLVAPQEGVYMIGAHAGDGIRLTVNGKRVIDEWGNKEDITLARPFHLKKGEEVDIELQYRQRTPSGHVRLVWSRPDNASIAPNELLKRVEQDGTTLLLLDSSESWMDAIAQACGMEYGGYYTVGKDWIGGIHFVKSHPLFEGLPVDCAMGWPYQQLVQEGDRRMGFMVKGAELVVGSYRSSPFHLGTAVGVITHGKGKILFSTLDIIRHLNENTNVSEVARKLFCNFVENAAKWHKEGITHK